MENLEKESANVSKLEFGKPEQLEEEEQNKYWQAPGHIIELASEVVDKNHQHLERCRLLILMYEDELSYRGKTVPGRVYKIHDREKTELEKDMEIVISEPTWERIANEGKEEAAMDWLLCFITVGSSPGSWTTKDPDFSGFYNNFERYGAWDMSLKNLKKRMQQMKIK
jgi:hypothetical protein